MDKQYMVEMCWEDGRPEPEDFEWYHATVKEAITWAREYASKTGAGFFTVLYVFDGGHYRTKYSEVL